MAETPQTEVSELLVRWSHGNQEALNQLMPLVYSELRRLAKRHLRLERLGHTLQTTALVHEAYLKLVNQKHYNLQNRIHFFAITAEIMRRILAAISNRMDTGDVTTLANPDIVEQIRKQVQGEGPVELQEGPEDVKRFGENE